MTPKETLQAARALIEAGWCQGTYAKNAEAVQVDLESPDASFFCIRGAVMRACLAPSGDVNLERFNPALAELLSVVKTDMVSFNDTIGRTKEEVLEAFDEAIASC